MLRSCARLLRTGTAMCQLKPATSIPRRFSVTHPCLSQTSQTIRDYGYPNETWSQNMRDLYNKFLELSKSGKWKQIPSYNTTVHHMEGDPVESRQEKRLFTRNLDKDGVGFEYTMFYNKAEKRMVTLFQPGPYLEGPPGFTHGGCIATIIDSTAGACAVYSCGSVMTANLNVNYRNPIPLSTTVIVDGRVDRVEGRKVYTSCEIRSHDDQLLHNEATALFITLSP
ncbi:acyl-coenzyme A thioesterase THEM4-like isoform 2-T3 [Discoglossus pictus]